MINWGLIAGFNELQASQGMEGGLLTKTASGMGILYKGQFSKNFSVYNQVFMDDPKLLHAYREYHAKRLLTPSLFN
ncbi:MAG: hypothetical protein HQM02_04435 [Magnetococcales bacterium]|nr:hypothetical protein [Magnetococcales bacterium]